MNLVVVREASGNIRNSLSSKVIKNAQEQWTTWGEIDWLE